MRWSLRAVVHSLRYKTIVSKLRKLDRKLIKAVARRTHAVENETLTGRDHGTARAARENMVKQAVSNREQGTARQH